MVQNHAAGGLLLQSVAHHCAAAPCLAELDLIQCSVNTVMSTDLVAMLRTDSYGETRLAMRITRSL